MVNTELIINNQLCDIVNPFDLGVRFQREILIPSEITTKDVQYSFTIKLPTSNINNTIFNFANVEEVKNKFNYEYNALLIVDSIKVFDGKFRLTEIDEDTYKGNLYIPSAKSIKDIFGDKKLNENGSWVIPFADFAPSITDYNTNQQTKIQPCIFPFALYGLIPKQSINPNAVVNGEIVGEYTAKDLWDEYVRLGIEDFPPSVNCLQMLQTIFKNNNYTLSGTAFEDSRLTNLFVSYKNEADYVQEWNWGRLCSFNIQGNWESVRDRWQNYRTFERNIERNESGRGTFYVTNLLDCNRVNFTSISDSGTNIITSSFKDKWNDDRYKRNKAFITIPKSGLYKIKLKASIAIEEGRDNSGKDSGWKWTDDTTGNVFTSGGQYKRNRCNYFDRKRYEVQLVRDFGSGDFSTGNKIAVGSYFQPNNPQNTVFNGDSVENFPKYFPKPHKALLVDASTDEKFICGFRWGKVDGSDYNPKGYQANYMFIKNGYSWNNSYTQKNKIYSAYNNPDGYWCWGSDDNAKIPINPDTGEEVEGGDDVVSLAWRESNRYQTTIRNIPNSYINASREVNGDGELYQIIWLDKGEHITLLAVSEANDYRKHYDSTLFNAFPAYMSVNFELDVKPFRTDNSWIKINNNSNGFAEMDWNDLMNFRKDDIDLIKFLPADVKTDEWIENFTKAFNLTLRMNGLNHFDLDVKQTNTLNTTSVIDLESKANIRFRNNTPLGLPSAFELGFTVNQEEEGFVASGGEDGGGRFETGTVDGKILTQTSNFSYCWYKDIRKKIGSENEKHIQLPIISKSEVWAADMTYSEGVQKLYTSLSQRFWYYKGLLNDVAGDIAIGGKQLKLADVSNTFNKDKILDLDYKSKSNSILTTYFTVIVSNDTNYTEIECYLTPDEYDRLDGSSLVKWNGDLYYISSVDGYDITEKNRTKLKLIRKMN